MNSYLNLHLNLHLIEAAIAISFLEGLLLYTYHIKTGRGLAFSQYGINLGSGMLLMLAIQWVLYHESMNFDVSTPISTSTNAATTLVMPVLLLCGGVLHWIDLWKRWPSHKTIR